MPETAPPTDSFTARLQRIRGLIATGQLKQAAEALNAAQKQAPTDARVPLLGMRLAEQAGNIAAATQAARRALKLEPSWHVAQIELARVLTRQQQSPEAMQLAVQALAGAPDNAQVVASAINVARFAGDAEQTLKWAEDGVRRFPDDAGIRLFLARYLMALGRYADAATHFEFIHERAPRHVETLRGLLDCALAEKDMARVQRHADELLAIDPRSEETLYWSAVARGETPPTQPREMVGALFDDYAQSFDMHLVRGLQYHVPQRVAEILLAAHPDRKFNALDLGCGTGLVGLYLGRIDGHIIGVDLSEKMIEQAARHNLYSRFHRVNVLDALSDTPGDLYEAITCTDVLIYVGDLAPVISNALRILKADGLFVFSCESADEDGPDLVLRATNRYAHKASAVEAACRAAGFDRVEIKHLPQLRIEGGQPLPGFIVVAHKPAAA